MKYTVHRVSPNTVPVETEVAGQKVAATVDTLEVEFVPTSHPHTGTVVLRFVGEERAVMLSKFPQGAVVDVPWESVVVAAGEASEA